MAMSPEQWARVFEAGYRQLEHVPLASPVVALGTALEAMSDECKIITWEGV